MGADFECLMHCVELDTGAWAKVFSVCERALDLSPRGDEELLIYGDDPIVPLRATSLHKDNKITGAGISKIIGRYLITLPDHLSTSDLSVTFYPAISVLGFAIDENLVFGKLGREPTYGEELVKKLFSGWRTVAKELPVIKVRYGTEGGPVEALTLHDWESSWDPNTAFSDERRSSYFQSYWG